MVDSRTGFARWSVRKIYAEDIAEGMNEFSVDSVDTPDAESETTRQVKSEIELRRFIQEDRDLIVQLDIATEVEGTAKYQLELQGAWQLSEEILAEGVDERTIDDLAMGYRLDEITAVANAKLLGLAQNINQPPVAISQEHLAGIRDQA
ncbi:hypothetical protein [Corynebacterium cystitidis]|uniref:hypothetical protein n=1 Tax=Corynebacterium cystitidis TaxID=35757 RepID=UPI00211E7021|nr:hypothetical protein [Corynebacterium cystitidis]